MRFRDLKQQYQLHKEDIDVAIQEVINHADFISGSKVGELEKALAEYVGVKYCITCANGTDALQLALMAWNIGKGDAVFIPDFTFFSSGEVTPLVGATPVFVDIEEETYNISPESLERAIKHVLQKTKLKPRVIVTVDLFGQPADYVRLRKISDQYNLLILEDGAQGFGGRIDEQKACSFGDISTTSFFPAKPLGCYGDGGAVFTNNDAWAELLRSYRIHGKGKDKYDNIRIGMNSRLDTIQAAVLLEKLKFFEDEISMCNLIAAKYTEQLAEVVKVPAIRERFYSSWAQYTICFQENEERNRAVNILEERGIPTAIYYRKPMHCQEAFSKCGIQDMDYCVTERVCQRCLSLPMHPYLSMDDIEKIIDVMKQMKEK